MNRACKVNCKVSPGMFRGEYMAKLRAIGPDGQAKDVHAFVNRISLESVKSGRALLRATLVSKNRSGIGVVLPQPTFENGPSVLVPRDTVTVG